MNCVFQSKVYMMATFKIIHGLFEKNLKLNGVRPVTDTSAFGQALCCLYENLGKPVKIEDIRTYVTRAGIELPGGGDSLQVRHLALQYGYNMLKGGEINPLTKEKIPKSSYVLLDLEKPCPSFMPAKRKTEASGDDWSRLKEQYNSMCVNCGSKEGEFMRWEPYKKTVLQQGHMDPRKPLTLDNTIPQCSYCNQQYKDKAIFNNKGQVIDFNKSGFKGP